MPRSHTRRRPRCRPASSSSGRTSRTRTAPLRNLVETNAPLQPGDSGGPLLNGAHEVIGMDSAAAAGFTFEHSGGDSYAIPIDTAMTLAKQIAAGRSSTLVHVGGTAFLGV